MPSTLSNDEVKERVDLCLYSPLDLHRLFCGELTFKTALDKLVVYLDCSCP